MNRSDEALYEQLIGGDLSAFDQLYDRYAQPLFGFALRHVGERAEAEDVLHDVFVQLLRERARTSELRSFRAWIFSVARHRCLNVLRSRQRGERAMAALIGESRTRGTGAAEAAGAASRDDALQAAQAAATLRAAVSRLPGKLAEVYELRAAGMSYDETASVLQIPVGTVKSRMNEIVRRLRLEVAS